MVERKMVDDEQYGVIEKMPKDLARAGRYKVEMDAVSLLENGFSNTGYDKKPLFAKDHPLLNGGTCSNLIEGELNVENLQKAIISIELLNSVNAPDTELNNVNSIKGKLKIVVMEFLESDTSWFVMDSARHELNFFWRVDRALVV